MSKDRKRFDDIATQTFQIPKDDLDLYYDYFKNKPEEEATALIRKAAEQGDPEAQYKFGYICNSELIGKLDYSQALFWYQKAAEHRHPEAQFKLGFMYTKGLSVDQDLEKAAFWFEEAADQGDSEAQYKLGLMYANGKGVKNDDKKAIEWFKKSAKQGNSEAQVTLGLVYLNKQCLTNYYRINQNNRKIFKWVYEAAIQNNLSAQYLLGLMYEYGTEVKQNDEEALKWYQKATNQGYQEIWQEEEVSKLNYMLNSSLQKDASITLEFSKSLSSENKIGLMLQQKLNPEVI